MRRHVMLSVLLVSCAPGGDGAGAAYVARESRLLGLNDVTFLLPLEGLESAPGMPRPEAVVPAALFDRLTTMPGDVLTELARLRVVAVRFDICDRDLPGPCPSEADGSLRLVLQPLLESGGVEDVAFHAFYPVPRAEMPQVVDELRGLARLQELPRSSPVRVNTAFLNDLSYRQQLSGLVARYASAPRLHRLTLFGQLTFQAALVWVFRGVQLEGTRFEAITIPGIDDENQEVRLFSPTSYTASPMVDAPVGFLRALTDRDFERAGEALRRESLESLAAVDNPALHTPNTVQCVSCHAATTVLAPRASQAAVPLEDLTNRFTSATFDLTPLGDEAVRFRTLRAFGYFEAWPLVSQRVVNETANVLHELEQRFPAAR